MPGCAVSDGACEARAERVTGTWNDGFGAEESAGDHDAQEGVPFLERKLGHGSHVLKSTIVDEDGGRSAELADRFRQCGGNFFLAGNIAADKGDGGVCRGLNVPAHGGIANILPQRMREREIARSDTS